MKKTKRTPQKIIATFFPSLLFIGGGIAKLLAIPVIVEKMASVNMLDYLPYLGVVELTLGLLFMFRKTIIVALVLLSCYFSGAIATELSHGLNGILPMIFITLSWISAYVRKQQYFMMISRDSATSPRTWASTSLSINK